MGKIALVTGAYKGYGLEWCRQLGQAAYIVILTARDLAKANETAEGREGISQRST